MKTQPYCKIPVILLLLGLPMMAPAAIITLTASDAGGTTSLNSAGKWSDGNPPSPANDYYTSIYFARTPTGSAGVTFAGHSLTLQAPSGQGSPERNLLYKGGGGDTITINNLTNAVGGVLNNGGSGAVTPPTFTGNLWTIAGNSTILSDQGSTIVGYPLAGSAILTNLSGQTRTITYTGSLAAFTGEFYITNSCTVILNSGSSPLGNPAVSNPAQITIGAGCVFEDNAGLTFNNANGGFMLAGSATISAESSTVIAEPIADGGNNFPLTLAGTGTLKLSTPATYGGGTLISSGTFQLGVANALAAPATAGLGDLTNNATLDLNTFSLTINGLSGSGTVDTEAGGTPTLTIGANGDSGTFTGSIQNSSGALSVTKTGAGTETFSGGYSYSGTTLVTGGTLSLNTAGNLPGTPGNFTVNNGAVLQVDVSSGNSLPVNNLVLGNSTNIFGYGTVTANPTYPAVNCTGGISAPGTAIVIALTATGLQPGTITLIKYTGTALASLANFQLSPPPGVAATLVNNTANHSIDLHILSIPNVLAWNGLNGTAWDLSTPNWTNTLSGGITVFRQYTNNGVVAGDAVTFDDTLTNSLVGPQPTNVVLNSVFYAFPVVVNSTLPYSISGSGGITGVTSLAISNTGSLTLLTSNSFTGGVNISDTELVITNDSALGSPAGPVILNGTTLQYNGSSTNNVRPFSMPVISYVGVSTNNTVRLGGVISGAGASFNKNDNGTLILAANETFTGNLFLHGGFTVIDTGGAFTNGNYNDVGQNTTDAATLTLQGTGSLLTTSDFNLGDLDSSIGTLNMTGNSTLTVNAFYIGSANASGSTASGTVNQSGGTITEISTTVGTFCIGGRTSASAVGVYNMSGGTLTANAGIRVGSTGIGTLNQSGGTINAIGGINLARIAGSFGTNNLTGGVLSTYNVASSTGTNAVFNFNGGTLQANFAPPGATWFSGAIQANILAGGAIIDSSNNIVTIATPLLAGSAAGGLTKKGSGTLNLTAVNTFTGPITNNAGTLFLNSTSTYPGAVVVNAGTLELTPATTLQGGVTINNNGVLSVVQQGTAATSVGNLTFNGAASGPGGALALTMTAANNPNVPMVNCGTLTLTGTNTINLAAANVGTLALIKYTGTIAGSGNCTNLALPQGGLGYISNNATASTLYAVVTSTGPGLVWTGTNTVNPNLWDINATTNWLVNAVPTSYHQIISPGDAVMFTDTGSGAVTVNTNVAPASLVISNNAKTYTFSGVGGISGPGGLELLGPGTTILNLTNETYLGNTIISNGVLEVGNTGTGAPLSPTASLVIGPNGTLQLSAQLANVVTTVNEFTGSGHINYTGGINSILSFGGSAGGTWNGSIGDNKGGGLSLTKNGTGTWVVGGTNYLNNGDYFNAVSQNQFNNGATIITNGGFLGLASDEFWVAYNPGSTSTVYVAGGTVVVSNNWLRVGYNDTTANGTLVVNSGTVIKAGANTFDVGANTATGTLIVNGGQVLNSGALWLGDGTGASGTLDLNGGLLQATVLEPNGSPATSVAYFDGGTLQAVTNSTDFLLVSSMVMSNGLILDDNGFAINIASEALQSGDSFTGGLVKKGAGQVYLDNANTYTGATLVTNGLLAGVGSVSGPVVVAPSGDLGAGDAGSVGSSFTINNNLTLQGNVTLRISKTGDSLTQDQLDVNGNVIYGGLLTVTNATSDDNVLTTTDSFQLFSVSGSHSGNFTGIAGSPGTGLAYHFNPATGVLSIVVNTIPSTPTNLTFSVSNGSLNVSWPSSYIGWILQAQTNTLGSGLGTNWVDLAGTSATDTFSLPLTATNPAVFVRLRHP
jgi:autotransporter-associated beta strand protein